MGLLSDIAKNARELISWEDTSQDDVPFDEMQKALAQTGLAEPTDEKPRALFHDPYSVMDWGGWRQRPSNLTYESLRMMSVQNTVIAAIIQLRTNQLAAFSRPQQGVYDKGYRIIKRDRRDNAIKMTSSEQRQASELEAMLETTAFLQPDERPADRDSFRDFVKKSTRDALTYDQMCHPSGTQILMGNGSYKDIEDVEIGDQVFTHKGVVRRVTETFQRAYTGEMHRLKYRGQTIEATAAHPLLVERHPHLKNRNKLADKRYHREWVEASDVERGQYLVCPDFELPQEPFAGVTGEPATAALARVMGLYTGDGHNQHGTAVWTFHEDAQDAIDAVTDVFPSARVRPYIDRRAVSIRVRGVGAWFSDHCGPSSGGKRVPAVILAAPTDLKIAFLGGYIEADGHLRKSSAILCTTSEDLKAGLTILCGNMGMFVAWIENGNEKRGWSRCWNANISGEEYRYFARSAGLPIADPDRPRNPSIYAEGHHYLKINEVSRYDAADLPVYNFEVDEDHSYIANGIVSHNCWEKIRDRAGRPSRFICLPAETIRPAVADTEHMTTEELRSRVAYLQVYDASVIAEFGLDDLAWCIMNPRSDLRANGFGFAPTEQIVRLVTAWLYGFEYNSRFFTQGSAIKGILNIKGSLPDRQLRAFRRMWYSMVSGVQNSWKTPILNSEDIQWVSMHTNNRDMEYGQWMDWLTKLICSVYGIDPVEINFIFGNSGQTSSLSQSRPNEAEVVESKDKGLAPLADHISDNINRHIIWEMAPELEFAFTGLDAKAESKERERRKVEGENWKFIDEIRAEMDEPPLPDGKGQMIMNAAWTGFVQGGEDANGGTDLGSGESDGSEDKDDPFGDDVDDPSDIGQDDPADVDDDSLDDSQNEALAASASLSKFVGEELRKAERRESVTKGRRRIDIKLGS